MWYYLLSPVPCAVSVNGVYQGVNTGNYSVIRANGLISLTPLPPRYLPLHFYTDLPKTTEYMRVIDLYGGFLLLPTFPLADAAPYKLLARREMTVGGERVLVRLTQNGSLRLSLQSARTETFVNVPSRPTRTAIETREYGDEAYLFVFLAAEKTTVAVFAAHDGFSTVLFQTADDARLVGDVLTLTERKRGVLTMRTETAWTFRGGVKASSSRLYTDRPAFTLPPDLFPYAFLQTLLLGGDVSAYLSPRLRPRADELPAFLGDFRAVLPPPHFADADTPLLLYADRADYARVTLLSGLVDNVSLLGEEAIRQDSV